MNANTPYAGAPGVTPAGKQAVDDAAELTPEQKRALRNDVSAIASLTREYLPSEYQVNTNVSSNLTGPRATVAVQPPIGNPVSAGFSPEEADFEKDSPIESEDQQEVARGLAASAALQMKQAMQNKVTPTAR